LFRSFRHPFIIAPIASQRQPPLTERLPKKARAAGLVHRKSGAPVRTSTSHSILRNRLYSGEFEWNGRRYVGKHQPLAPPELWEEVQAVLNGRYAKKHRRAKHQFAFSGLIACGQCGCSLVGEIKSQRYVYHHCTGFKTPMRRALRPRGGARAPLLLNARPLC
jgi:site-specific DNA recombinase